MWTMHLGARCMGQAYMHCAEVLNVSPTHAPAFVCRRQYVLLPTSPTPLAQPPKASLLPLGSSSNGTGGAQHSPSKQQLAKAQDSQVNAQAMRAALWVRLGRCVLLAAGLLAGGWVNWHRLIEPWVLGLGILSSTVSAGLGQGPMTCMPIEARVETVVLH